MRTAQEIVSRFKNFFPEEAFLSGLSSFSRDEEWGFHGSVGSDVVFLDRFDRHLSFYEACLFPLRSERLTKLTNYIFYHIQKGVKIDNDSFSLIQATVRALSDAPFDLVESLSCDAFVVSVRAYTKFDVSQTDNFTRLTSFLGEIPRGNHFQSPMKDFGEWQNELYHLSLGDINQVTKEAYDLQKRITPFGNIQELEIIDMMSFCKSFIDFFRALVAPNLSGVRIIEVPDYARGIIPIAAAYTMDRLSDHPIRMIFLNTREPITLEKIILIVFHEAFGHLEHFRLVDTHCKDRMKFLPYLSRFPLTEGFALLAEDYFIEIMQRKEIQHAVATMAGYPGYGDKLFCALQKFHLVSRLQRYIRYLFEVHLYVQGLHPKEAVKKLSDIFHLNEELLEQQLFPFLITPGYASCYIAGYKKMKALGAYRDSEFRREVGKQGFDLLNDSMVC